MASISDNQEINLHVEGKVFKVIKNVLCDHSDYFVAMFSGNYVEHEKKDITIDVVDANSMEIILRYMNIGLIDLSELSLHTVGTLAMAANFLQITELMKQIAYWLDLELCISNWVEIMMLAEKVSYIKLEQLAGSFGLLSFVDMKPEYIPNIQMLFWYLSHPYLNTESELDVFKFGYNWMVYHESNTADNLLIIIGCLDVKRLSTQNLKEISIIIPENEMSLAAKVVKCFIMILDNKIEVNLPDLITNGNKLRETFTESVYSEILNIVRNSNQRKLQYTAVAATWVVKDGKLDFVPHDMHTFTEEKGFERWLEVADKNMWGWNLAAWGANKLLQVCGEHGRGTGRFMKDVKVYDTLREEWIHHGVKLPSRRHAGVAVNGDSLFIVGGVGAFRVIEDSTIIYDLRKRSFRVASKFPEAIQSPAICSHDGAIYASGHKHIYRYTDTGDHDGWTSVVGTDIRANRMISFNNYIYCSQNYFSNLYRFRPGIDDKLEMVAHFSAPPVAFCKLENRLLLFTRYVCGQSEELKVEEYSGSSEYPAGCSPKVIWYHYTSNITVNDVAGACALVISMPDINNPPSSYHQKYITRYAENTCDK